MRKWILNGLIVVFAAVFLVSGYMLISYFAESKAQEDTYDQLADIMAQAMATVPNTPSSPDAGEDAGSPWITVTDPETGEPVEILPEYTQLYAMNNDIVGWLQLPGTKLNYPVMQTPDSPDYYLKRNFHKESTSHGCLYAREDCDLRTPSDNITIYGHHMKDGSMFACLDGYKKKAFWEANQTVQFNTLQERHTYEVFAVFLTTASVGKGFQYHNFVNAYDQEEFDTFVSKCKALSLYDTGITPAYGDKLITLSTCEYSQTNGRLVVVARRGDG